MKPALLAAAAAFGLVFSVTGAFALTSVTIKDGTDAAVSPNPNPAPNLAVPSDILDSITTQQTPGGGQSMQFGNFRLEMSGPRSSGSDGPNSPFLSNPSSRLVPSLQHP